MPELRLALRALSRHPAFTWNAVLSLALGIGATAAIFSVLDRAVLRPLPIPEPERLVLLYQEGPLDGSVSSDEPGGPSFSYPLVRGLQRAQASFTGLAGSRAHDWTQLEDRMGYIVDLFRRFHLDDSALAAPYDLAQVRAIEAGQVPAGRL